MALVLLWLAYALGFLVGYGSSFWRGRRAFSAGWVVCSSRFFSLSTLPLIGSKTKSAFFLLLAGFAAFFVSGVIGQ